MTTFDWYTTPTKRYAQRQACNCVSRRTRNLIQRQTTIRRNHLIFRSVSSIERLQKHVNIMVLLCNIDFVVYWSALALNVSDNARPLTNAVLGNSRKQKVERYCCFSHCFMVVSLFHKLLILFGVLHMIILQDYLGVRNHFMRKISCC